MDVGFWLLFLSAVVVLTLSPGPDLLYVLSKTVTQGRKIGVASSLGVCSGAAFHVVAAALGISAILATSATAFAFVKYIGAAYLVYLGYKALKSAGKNTELLSAQTSRVSFWAAYKQGMLIDILNPKVAIFFMAFLPQFIREGEGSVTFQLLILGIIVVVFGFMIELVLIFLVDRASSFLRGNSAVAVWMDRVLGTILLGLGVRLALTERVL